MLVEISKFGKNEVVVVSSLDVADTFGKEHNKVLRDIRELGCSNEFRLSNFGQSEYINIQNKKMPMYYMTRDGFTLLVMGYTGEKAMQFKEAYIRQFNQMEQLLIGKLKEREKGIAVRQALTNTIKECGENERMKGFAYSTYTDLIYKLNFGKTSKQIREEKQLSKSDNLRDTFTADELKDIQRDEMLVSGLIGNGWGYKEIKQFLLNSSFKKIE